MKTGRCFIVVALLAFAWPAVVSAQDFSVALRGGPSFPADTLDGDAGHEAVIDWGRGYAVGGALIYALPSGLFTEAEFSFLHTPAVSEGGTPIGGNDESELYLGNVGYEFGRTAQGRVRPMLGFGVGLVRVHQHQQYLDDDLATIVNDDGHWNNFAFQARAGVAIQVTNPVALSLGYRFIRINATEEPQQTDDIVINIGTKVHHLLEFGVRFRF